MEMVGSGAGAGDESSATGISTSSVPTVYGPVYLGNKATGLRLENQDVMTRSGKKILYAVVKKFGLIDLFSLCLLCTVQYTKSHKFAVGNTEKEKDKIGFKHEQKQGIAATSPSI